MNQRNRLKKEENQGQEAGMIKRKGRVEDFPPLCMFCAEEIQEDAYSAEHFVPKCFYEKSIQNDVDLKDLELPAHKSCNNASSSDDEYVRNILAVEDGAENSRGAKALQTGKISNFMMGNGSAHKVESTYKNVSLKPAYTESDIYVGKLPSIEVDWATIERVLFKIMKGIFFKASRKPMPSNFSLSVNDVRDCPLGAMKHNLNGMPDTWQSVKGDPDVFQCRYAIQKGDNGKIAEAHFLINLFKNRSFFGSALSEESLTKHRKKDLFKPSSPQSKVLVPFYII